MKVNKQLQKIIPPEFLQALALAMENHKLGLTLVVSNAVLADVNEGKAALLSLQDGGAIVLISEATVERIYQEER